MATGRPHRLSLCDVSLGFILRCGVVASSSSSTNTDAMTTVPVHFDVVAESLEPSFQKDFPNYRRGLARGTPGGFVLTPDFAKMADDVYNIPLRSDDTWIVTFPKCGTTWTQEMVWLLAHDCDFEGAKQPLGLRSPFLEFPSLVPPVDDAEEFMKSVEFLNVIGGVDTVGRLASPRTIKTHLPLHLLPPKLLDTCKVVYVARNPKDVIVSFYHHHRLFKAEQYEGTFQDFVEYFMKDLIHFAPFFGHILEAWKLRHHANMHFMFYEDMKRDLRGELKKLAAFMGKTVTDQQLERLAAHLGFESFSKNDAVNYEAGRSAGIMNPGGRFCRKGKTGDWKNHFSPELNDRVDRWIEANLAGSDLQFVTQLDEQD